MGAIRTREGKNEVEVTYRKEEICEVFFQK